MSKKTVSYLRVSTEAQSVEPQRIELARYAEWKQIKIDQEYTDVISGTKARRVGLDKLLADVEKGLVGTILTVKIDRLARSVSNFSDLVKFFEKHGVTLVIPGQNIDTSSRSSTSRLMINVLSTLAEFERDLIVERTNAGLEAARAKGNKAGRKKGYGRELPLEEFKKLCAEGKSQREAAKILNFPASTLTWRVNNG